MTYSLGKQSLSHLVGVDLALAGVVKLAITLTEQDFTVHMGVRSAAEQNEIYKQGRSKPGKIVTWKDGYKNKSNHQAAADGLGKSVDLVPWVDGGPEWDETWATHYLVAVAMSKAAKQLGVRIKWGGNWYEAMNDYGSSLAEIKAAVERYKVQHPGPDGIDGPHFELAA